MAAGFALAAARRVLAVITAPTREDESSFLPVVIGIVSGLIVVLLAPIAVIIAVVSGAGEYDQIQGENYYDSGSGTDYGDVQYEQFIYYNQTDARWGSLMYGISGTIAQAGCGPTAVAMAVATLADESVTPLDVAQWSVDNGYRAEPGGSYHSLIPAACENYGLKVTPIGQSGVKLQDALERGNLVIAIMSKGHFTSSGHFIVLRGITEEGKILVGDSASKKRTEKEWDLDIFLNECNKGSGAGGPFWVVGC